MTDELFHVQGALRAHASMDLDINVRLGEWLDISVDAKATKIVVDVFGKKGATGGVRITDDGKGHLVLADYLRFGRGTKEDEDVTGHFGHGMKVVFETARMYTEAPPEILLNRLFGVPSFEHG